MSHLLSLLSVLVCCAQLVSARPTPGWNVPATDRATMPERLSVSSNHRYLVDEQGRPFFYLADTAWELFHRLTREEADMYLDDRARKGFTAIQAVAIAELDGISTPNAYGHLPFVADSGIS